MIFFTHLWDILGDRPAAYRAIYPDGRRTWPMKRSSALNLTKIFGGHLLYDPPEKEKPTFNDPRYVSYHASIPTNKRVIAKLYKYFKDMEKNEDHTTDS